MISAVVQDKEQASGSAGEAVGTSLTLGVLWEDLQKGVIGLRYKRPIGVR